MEPKKPQYNSSKSNNYQMKNFSGKYQASGYEEENKDNLIQIINSQGNLINYEEIQNKKGRNIIRFQYENDNDGQKLMQQYLNNYIQWNIGENLYISRQFCYNHMINNCKYGEKCNIPHLSYKDITCYQIYLNKCHFNQKNKCKKLHVKSSSDEINQNPIMANENENVKTLEERLKQLKIQNQQQKKKKEEFQKSKKIEEQIKIYQLIQKQEKKRQEEKEEEQKEQQREVQEQQQKQQKREQELQLEKQRQQRQQQLLQREQSLQQFLQREQRQQQLLQREQQLLQRQQRQQQLQEQQKKQQLNPIYLQQQNQQQELEVCIQCSQKRILVNLVCKHKIMCSQCAQKRNFCYACNQRVIIAC